MVRVRWVGVLAGLVGLLFTLSSAGLVFGVGVVGSPSSNVNSGWVDPANAYGDGGGVASSSVRYDTVVYGGFGFDLPSDVTIKSVKIRLDALNSYSWYGVYDQILVKVSVDGGSTFLTHPSGSAGSFVPLLYETSGYVDVTSWTSWTSAKLSDGSLRVWLKHSYWTVGSSPTTISLDYVAVEVTYVAFESVDSVGGKKDTFSLTEPIYVKGAVLSGSTTYDLYVVADCASWVNGQSIPARISGTATSITTSAGAFGPTMIWASPVPGTYDIIIDVKKNGIYDAGFDLLDTDDVVTTAGLLVVSEYALGSLLAVMSCLAGFMFYRKRRCG
jgi:hypothetical protein